MKSFLTAMTLTIFMGSAFAADHHHKEPPPPAKTNHGKNSLTLNQGKKWSVDQVMKENMEAIHQQFKIYSTGTKINSPNEARKLSAVISASVQNIISKCKMEQKQDEAFHLILGDLFAVATDLEKAERVEAAQKLLAQALKNYSDYFEHSFSN